MREVDPDGVNGGSGDEPEDAAGPIGPAGTPAQGRSRRRPEASVTQRALGLLTRREHSRKELVRKLTSRGMEAAEVESAVNRLTADGWQDDARFAESLVRARISSGYGPLRIRAELATHGLDRDAIARALDSFDGDWAEIASDLVRRRFGPVASFDMPRRRKAADFLIRRGFDRAHMMGAVREPGDG